ncbi:MAG: DUF1858 domain-containing protein [Fidelibacterota bacterium]
MIDSDIYIEDLVRDYPIVVKPLADMGLVCVYCGEPVWGTLGELIASKGVTKQERIIQKLNEITQSNKP